MARAAPGVITSAVACWVLTAAGCSDSTKPFVCNAGQPVVAPYYTYYTTAPFTTDTLDMDGLTVTGSNTVHAQGGLGVVGGLGDNSVDGTAEFLKFGVDAGAATDVSYFVGVAGSTSGGTLGKARVEAFDHAGTSLGTHGTSLTGSKDVSAMFDGVPISAFIVTSDGVGSYFSIAQATYSPCQ